MHDFLCNFHLIRVLISEGSDFLDLGYKYYLLKAEAIRYDEYILVQ